MPIEIKAAYNSYSGDRSLFGYKWTFNHNIRVRNAGTKFEVVEGDGFVNAYTRERNLEEAKKALIEQLLVAKKKADVQAGELKAATVYEEYKRKLDADESFREEQEKKLLTSPKPLGPGKYYSFARGPSVLEMKTDKTFIRSFQNGAAEYFDADGHLIKSADRNENFMTFVYQGDNLTRINDMCSRYVTFGYGNKTERDLVTSIKDSLGREIHFEHDKDRRLKTIIDPQKRRTEYTYDTKGNMTAILHPARPDENLNFKYNEKFEVESQTGPGKQTTKYKRTFVGNNPNHSITEISKLLDKKLQEREVHEFKVKEFESVTKLNASGKETKKEMRKFSPETGYPVSILDGQGRGDLYEYDPKNGNLLKRASVTTGEKMEFSYHSRCNQVEKMTATRPSKPVSITEFNFDNRCNLKSAIETQNKKTTVSISLQYNSNGKITFITDELSKDQVAFTYWKYGKPESITLKDVGTLLVKYSDVGEILSVETFPHGKGKERFKDMEKSKYQSTILTEVRGTLDRMLSHLRPAGLNIGL